MLWITPVGRIPIAKLDYAFILKKDASRLVSTPSEFPQLGSALSHKEFTEFEKLYCNITATAALHSLYLAMKGIITKCIVCDAVLKGRQTQYCSTKCKNSKDGANSYESQQKRALTRKLSCVLVLGNCCSVCGYKKNLAALEFHHKDPTKKEFSLDSRVLSNTSMETIEKELKKCLLLCANCHRELHNPALEGLL